MALGYLPLQAAMVMLLVVQRPIIRKASALVVQHPTSKSATLSKRRLTTQYSILSLPSSPISHQHHHHHNRQSRSSLNAIESRELRFFNSSPILDDIMAAAAASNNGSTPKNNYDRQSLSTIHGKMTDSKDASFFSSLFYRNQSPAASLARREETNGSTGGESSDVGEGLVGGPFLSFVARQRDPRKQNDGPSIDLTEEEVELFDLLETVNSSTGTVSTLRVAGGWVRDKLLAKDDFQTGGGGVVVAGERKSVERLTSKFKGPSSGRQGTKIIGGYTSQTKAQKSSLRTLINQCDTPVDIDVALDDMLGREFADYLNDYLTLNGREKLSVGMVLKNPEKSKHLETATMKVGKFWVDFVNLRAEEYTVGSRIPDMVRIGTAVEDAFRRDLTINALFYNINTGKVEDITGRGFEHLRKGIIATPLPALTTLLDDPLRVLRSVRFAARLRFTMDDDLRDAAQDERVRIALAQKVARERIGSEVDLMLRSQDPVGAMRLLINLKLVGTVFPVDDGGMGVSEKAFGDGRDLLSTTHDHLCECKAQKPFWCETERAAPAARYYGVDEVVLIDDDEARRRLWYAAFLKPLRDNVHGMERKDQAKVGRTQGKKAKRSAIMKLMVDELKRPLRDADAVEVIMKAADDFTNLLDAGCDLSATICILGEVQVIYHGEDADTGSITCHMGKQIVNSDTEDDPLWLNAMEHRLLVSKVLSRVGPLWRAALILSLSEQLLALEQDDQLSYTIEGDVFEETHAEKREGIVQKYDSFAATMLQLGLIGIWSQEPLIDGREITTNSVLPQTPKGPIFREIMEEQASWMTTHPGGSKGNLIAHLRNFFPECV